MSARANPPIGRLRQRLRIDQPTATGDASFAWSPLATVWAAVEPQGLAERDTGGRMEGVSTLRVTIRWRGDVTSINRLALGARTLRVVATSDPTGDKRFLDILAEEETR